MISVGQRLAQERQKRGFSLSDVEHATKIKSSFLAYIEKGEYNRLPSPAYAQGFIKNYIQFLGLPVRETMALFRREFDEKKEFRVLPESLSAKEDVSSIRFRIRRRILLIACFFIVFAGFLSYQYRFAFINPPLTVVAPKENANVSREVIVSGSTDSNAVVTINNEAVVVDENGDFAKRIPVFSTDSVITIKAKNRLNKETTIQRRIHVED